MGILGLVDCSQNLCQIMVSEGAMESVQFVRWVEMRYKLRIEEQRQC